MFKPGRLEVATITPKPEQRKAVKSIYLGRDVFVWLPTGFGKSLCYEVLPFVMDNKLGRVGSAARLVLIVSPLIALMTDQVSSLQKRRVKAAVISSATGYSQDIVATEGDLFTCSHLYCPPELLLRREVLEEPAISKRIVAVVIDEAHCFPVVGLSHPPFACI